MALLHELVFAFWSGHVIMRWNMLRNILHICGH